jgi:transposase-like protein
MGAGICVHGRQRYSCKECKKSGQDKVMTVRATARRAVKHLKPLTATAARARDRKNALATGKYKCPNCSKNLTQKGALTYHVKAKRNVDGSWRCSPKGQR